MLGLYCDNGKENGNYFLGFRAFLSFMRAMDCSRGSSPGACPALVGLRGPEETDPSFGTCQSSLGSCGHIKGLGFRV